MRFVAVLCWILAFAAQPAWAASSPSLQPLERQLASLAAASPGDVGVAAVDLKTGELVSINGDTPFPMASTVKIAIAATTSPRSRMDDARWTTPSTAARPPG